MPLEVFALMLLTVWGACVGSFLNVVIYRVPEGLSVVSPPSRCPGCEKKLAIYDNVPVLAWLWLRGKCRFCKMSISAQYPLIEAATALLFFGLTYVYYFTSLREVFHGPGVETTWAVLGVHLVLLSMMIAATMIDAKLYIIPLGLPWLATAVAVVTLPLSVAMGWVPSDLIQPAAAQQAWDQLIPAVGTTGIGLGIGGGFGLLVAVLLLHQKRIPQSFADEPELPEGADPHDPENFFIHPHPRREILKEVLFLLPITLGAAAGVAAMRQWGATLDAPWVSVLGGVLLGYLVGGGIVWATRILGTLAFGKEAMGLGDVHLMAAIGAVIGWRDTTLAFFIAPFFGILAAIVTAGAAALLKGKVRVIPYGPYLCAAAVVVMVWRRPIFDAIFP